MIIWRMDPFWGDEILIDRFYIRAKNVYQYQSIISIIEVAFSFVWEVNLFYQQLT